jgi:hypothetical protein
VGEVSIGAKGILAMVKVEELNGNGRAQYIVEE